MKATLLRQRSRLPYVGVLIQCLDNGQNPLKGAFASGFIRREAEDLFLYTCWHVVTGFDPHNIQIGLTLPQRRYLHVALQGADKRQPGVEVIGGLQTLVLPLYDEGRHSPQPVWLQDDQHIEHPDLNAIGIYVPFWHDLVKLKLPAGLEVSTFQPIEQDMVVPGNVALIAPGDKCVVVGYPYGFSAFGPEQPTPVALTRFVASDRVAGRHRQFLLESIGAPGMSGGPVFIERDDELLLVGVYTGLIYPDYAQASNEKVTALGTVSDATLVLWGHLPMVLKPSTPVKRT